MQQRHVLSKCKRHYFEVTLDLELRSVLLRQTTSVIFFGNSAVRSSTGRTKSEREKATGQGEVSVFRDSNYLLELLSDSALTAAVKSVWTYCHDIVFCCHAREKSFLTAAIISIFDWFTTAYTFWLCCAILLLFWAPNEIVSNSFLRPP